MRSFVLAGALACIAPAWAMAPWAVAPWAVAPWAVAGWAVAAWAAPAHAAPDRPPAPPSGPVRPVINGPCAAAIAAAERTGRTAPGLLAAIGLVESGRRDPRTGQRQPWPWTVNAEGAGTYYPSKDAAIQAVQALQARGVQSVDVGCMQVNLLHHPAAFASLDLAFDPAVNAGYAARFLSSLRARTGEWPAAAAAYHSFTPELGAQYARLIANVWAGAPVPAAATPSGAEVVSFPDGGQLRIFRNAAPGRPRRVLGYLSGP